MIKSYAIKFCGFIIDKGGGGVKLEMNLCKSTCTELSTNRQDEIKVWPNYWYNSRWLSSGFLG